MKTIGRFGAVVERTLVRSRHMDGLKSAPGAAYACLFASLLFFSNLSYAQSDNRGTDFWVCFPQNAKHEAYAGLYFKLYITSDHAAKGVVTGPGNIRQDFSVRAGEVISVEIDTAAQV